MRKVVEEKNITKDVHIKHIVKENKENTVLTTKNKLIHKDNIRNVLPDDNINNSSEQITTIPNN